MNGVIGKVNRVLLGLAGLGLFVLGGSVLVGSLDLAERWGFSLPGWWPFRGPDDVLLGEEGRTRYRDDGWWWPLVFAVLGLLLALLLWWLLAQFRRYRIAEILVDSGDGAGAMLRGRALENAIAAETDSLEGISRTQVRLMGRRTQPRARLAMLLEARALPARSLARVSGEALLNARKSAGLDRLPAEVRLRAVRHRARRVT